MSAMAGIDQALWDIAGKTLGVPVHQMLGGSVRDRLKVYRWCGGDENSPAESAAEAKVCPSTLDCPRGEGLAREWSLD